MQMVHLDNVSKCFRLGTANEYGRLTEAVSRGLKETIGITKRTVAPKASPEEFASDSPRIANGLFWALRELNLSVQDGDILGIVGRNGAGKSTLLKLLARIISPTAGRVGVRGRVGSLLEVGTGFHPELTGRENIFLNGSILGMSRRDIKSRFDDIVEFADIGAFLDTPVKRYSSGMAVRLAFSVAAYLEPDVLIVDEVLAVGDQAFQDKCIGKAKELGKQGRTILLVSHNLSSVANLCTRAVYLKEGRLIADGLPGEIIDTYLQESVGSSGSRRWELTDAPKSNRFALRGVQIKSGVNSKQCLSEVDIDTDICIEVDFQVLEPGSVVTPGIRIKDETSTYVLWSTNATSMNLSQDPLYAQPLNQGSYRAHCTIPANFLNATRYLISVSLGTRPGEVDVDVENAISFLVHDTGVMRKEFTGNWSGPVIRPRLKWQTTPVQNSLAD